MATNPPPNAQLAEFFTQDANDRLRFQQEFSIAGFRSLILINGGAIIALLTYIGNAAGKAAAADLAWTFGGYVAGLIAATLAYLTAYAGQALLMWHASTSAFHHMGVKTADNALLSRLYWWSNVCIAVGALLCCLSLGAFLAGSIWAMQALM